MTWDIFSYWLGYIAALATVGLCFWMDKREEEKRRRDLQKEMKKEEEYWERKYREEKK